MAGNCVKCGQKAAKDTGDVAGEHQKPDGSRERCDGSGTPTR